ncbi:hypothetical protein C2U72_10870 [Prosthecomicrobium hirschii]|uniref:hypothetical protein n=1 Tax=Prosthecodimorpha hirschii TaxID=665126 RepID=UPI0011262046|nr:hypothetical protein [Prosthecomicrobium hirschii]TPQ50942.1 hypothetical protein C2U72_10870 [Prosthecomicrobium hirschii]
MLICAGRSADPVPAAGGLFETQRDGHAQACRADRLGERRRGCGGADDADRRRLEVAGAAADRGDLLQPTVPPDLEAGLLAHYLALRTAADPAFDASAFRWAYAILSVQRNTRILGVFARLKNRDGKPGYMRHYPRLWDYLDRSLREGVTLGVKLWYDAHVPVASRLRVP